MKDLTQAIGSFLRTYWAPIAAIATMVGVFFGPFLATKHKEKEETKTRHFGEIKTKVLKRLKEALMNYYLPTVHEKWVNITSNAKRKPGRFVSKEDYKRANRELEFELKIDDPYQSVLDRGIPPEKASPFIPDNKLYSCTKETHFPQFISRYEDFKRQFGKYNKSCLNAAKKIREQIKSKITLPSYTGLSGGTTPYICDDLLAIFVLKKRVEEKNNDFLDIEDRKDVSILKTRDRNLAQGTPKQIKECTEKIQNIARDTECAEDLVKQAKALVPAAETSIDEAEELLRRESLPGTCKYLRR